MIEEYEVREIGDCAEVDGEKLYKVWWKGYAASQWTWETEKSLELCLRKKNEALELEMEVLGHRRVHGELQYQVKWKGKPSSCNSWVTLKEAEGDLVRCIELYRDSIQLQRAEKPPRVL